MAYARAEKGSHRLMRLWLHFSSAIAESMAKIGAKPNNPNEKCATLAEQDLSK